MLSDGDRNCGLLVLFEGSRNGLLETGRGSGFGLGSSKGEVGLGGSGEPARLRKGLLDERLNDRPAGDR